MPRTQLDHANKDENFNKINITSDETCIYGFTVQSLQWVEKDVPGPKKVQQVQTNIKIN